MLKNRCLKTAIVLAGVFAAGLMQPRIANAGIVADAWWALFGPPGTPYFGYSSGYAGYYGPSTYTAGYYGGYTTYYGGYDSSGSCCPQRSYYVPSCSPCNSCNPCGCNPCSSCSPCSGGPCAVKGSGQQTFRKPSTDIQPPVPGKEDSPFESREGEKKFEKTRPETKEGDAPPPAGVSLGNPAPIPGSGENSNVESREVLKPVGDPPEKKGPIIKPTKPAPAKAPVEDKKTEEKMATKIDRVNYDRKITWQTATERTRLVIRPVIKSEKIARTTLSPNTGWKPGPKAPQIVQK